MSTVGRRRLLFHPCGARAGACVAAWEGYGRRTRRFEGRGRRCANAGCGRIWRCTWLRWAGKIRWFPASRSRRSGKRRIARGSGKESRGMGSVEKEEVLLSQTRFLGQDGGGIRMCEGLEAWSDWQEVGAVNFKKSQWRYLGWHWIRMRGKEEWCYDGDPVPLAEDRSVGFNRIGAATWRWRHQSYQ